MSFFSKLMNVVGPVIRSAVQSQPKTTRRRPSPAGRTAPTTARPGPTPVPRRPTATTSPSTEESPGRLGPDRTVEIDPRRVGKVRTSYVPVTDGDPDPGEIIWTWVPYEENDGQGKDRPVLVVAAESVGTVLVVQLTSKDHDDDGDFISVGAGDWDSAHRESWVNLERVLRVHPSGMRREAAALSRSAFEGVATSLSARYGWN